MAALHLVPIYTDVELVRALAERLGDIFGLATEVHPPRFDPEIAFDAGRGQYSSRLLLAALLREPAPQTARLLGVASVDLFIPALTYVFGEAQLDGRAAMVSLHRLRSELYGLPPAPALLFARLVKEAVHELGHTYGLVHCEGRGCVMGRSTYVEEIDLKGDGFCDTCRTLVRANASSRRNG